MKTFILSFLLLMSATNAAAQQTDHRTFTKGFIALAIAEHTAATVDTTSTLYGIPYWEERNPLTRPFVTRGPAVAYTAQETFHLSVTVLCGRMRASDHKSVRVLAWAIPIGLTSAHAIAAAHNYHLRATQPMVSTQYPTLR